MAKVLHHKQSFRTPVLIAIAAGLIILGYIITRTFAAGSAQMLFTPASGSYNIGADVAVQVRINTTDAVNAVQSDFTYPTSKLQFSSIDTTGSAFDVQASNTGGGGSVSIARGKIGTVTGNALVATVHFTALASGSAALTFQNSSALVRSSDNTNVLGTMTNGSYTINVPATPTPTPTPVSGGGAKTPTPTPKQASAKTPTPTPTPAPQGGHVTPTPTPVANKNAVSTPTPTSTPVTITAVEPSPSPMQFTTILAQAKTLGWAALAIPVLLLLVIGGFIALRRREPKLDVPMVDFAVPPTSDTRPTPPPPPGMPPSTVMPSDPNAQQQPPQPPTQQQ